MRGWDSVAQFTDQLFGHLRRADQRRWAHAYIQGLLSTPGKKSIRRLAAVASDSPTASQALHQFVNESPWEWTPACDQLRQWTEDRVRPRAWTIVPVVLPKRGDKSCGVHRRFVPRTGRTVNCQVGTAVFMSTDAGEFPVGWNLLLPAQWAHGSRREQARIPREVASSPEGVVLHLLDRLVQGSPHEDVPVIADLEGYMDARRLINGLSRRRRDFIVTVPESLPTIPFSPLARAHRKSVMTAAEILSQHRSQPRFPAGRTGQAQTRHGLVRIPGAVAGQQPQPLRLFTRPGTPAAGPGALWITNMVQPPVEELLRYTARRTATRETVDLLERGFGLRDFEGRSFPGWHRHMTLVSAAFAYSRLAAVPHEETARSGPGHSARGDGPAGPPLTPRVPWTHERPRATAPLPDHAPSTAPPGNGPRKGPMTTVQCVTGPRHVPTRDHHPVGSGRAGGHALPEPQRTCPPHHTRVPRAPGRMP